MVGGSVKAEEVGFLAWKGVTGWLRCDGPSVCPRSRDYNCLPIREAKWGAFRNPSDQSE